MDAMDDIIAIQSRRVRRGAEPHATLTVKATNSWSSGQLASFEDLSSQQRWNVRELDTGSVAMREDATLTVKATNSWSSGQLASFEDLSSQQMDVRELDTGSVAMRSQKTKEKQSNNKQKRNDKLSLGPRIAV
ncbi:hypothetical protein CRUP_005332 [Coryphaenoides rupestris]|nr:hypothetical protein CRUP_005332 [Coryphaenoides rupestris]